jgi:hypothetical protein
MSEPADTTLPLKTPHEDKVCFRIGKAAGALKVHKFAHHGSKKMQTLVFPSPRLAFFGYISASNPKQGFYFTVTCGGLRTRFLILTSKHW